MKLIELLFFLLALFVAASRPLDGIQYPLSQSSGDAPEHASPWKLNFSSAAPHYFSSVYGLLQQWPNTFFPNGHIIVPGEIAPHTKLFHGWHNASEPDSPEWLAFDIEMSYAIMGSTRNSHMLTYRTTQTVKVVYFDGESAALQGTGQLDTQMLHIYGNVTGPGQLPGRGLYGEYDRAIGLCDWLREKRLGGIGWGFEGVVRMNAGFELIWCNFTSPSLELISHLNNTAPLFARPSSTAATYSIQQMNGADKLSLGSAAPELLYCARSETSEINSNTTTPTQSPGPRQDLAREPFFGMQLWSWLWSATNHYGFSGLGPRTGESRVELATCGTLNYYSPKFLNQALARADSEQRELNLTKEGLWMGSGDYDKCERREALKQLTRRRRQHCLRDVSVSDALEMRMDSERALRDELNNKPGRCSGADWLSMTKEIVQMYATDLNRFRLIVEESEALDKTNISEVWTWLFHVRAQARPFLLPFLEHPSDPTATESWIPESSLAIETHARCKYYYTTFLAQDGGISIGPEEVLLKWAVEETMESICHVTLTVSFAVEGTWLLHFNDHAGQPDNEWRWDEAFQSEVQRWQAGMEELMAWLGWAGEWVKCEKTCGWDERCAIPMWPVNWLVSNSRPRRGERNRTGDESCHPSPTRHPANGARAPRPPFEEEEADLWEPKCVKADYSMWL